ncbi:hypothetical protein ODJ79_21505 [Actinoplanes sp. KI2]|uniref:hypothetical protein n=1 Tax=Actinoplanes sp. KI2 TaxID=2983315 RepID=UPI0021D56C78|nr:hypothetical protein [Actinoplanes sp. KI2]MCU7726314.1 hypothetical protein [Actinoplanes sp. KI2]
MTTRRTILTLTGAALVAACDLPDKSGKPEKGDEPPETVLADTRTGLVVLGSVRPGTDAAASADSRVIYAISGQDLVRFDPGSGMSTRSATLGGGWLPRVVSTDGTACALTRTPDPRATTELLVVRDGRSREYRLPGAIEPDAFTTGNDGLFVLDWLPAANPDHYRVRLLDLASGTIGPLLTRDKSAVPAGAEEEMRGERRQQAPSPDGQVLYTLYTHQPGHRHTRDLLSGRPGNAHAFVHVLHLTQRWAYCIDLPHPFGEGPPDGHAMAVPADGRELAVLDITSGQIAYAGTTALAVSGVVPAPAAPGAAASLAYSPEGARLFAGAGRTISTLDHGGTVRARWSMPADVRGLAVSRDGRRVYCGGADEVRWVDAAGATRGRVPVDGLLSLRSVR